MTDMKPDTDVDKAWATVNPRPELTTRLGDTVLEPFPGLFVKLDERLGPNDLIINMEGAQCYR